MTKKHQEVAIFPLPISTYVSSRFLIRSKDDLLIQIGGRGILSFYSLKLGGRGGGKELFSNVRENWGGK